MLLFMDSFDHYDISNMLIKYEVNSGGGAIGSITTGRFGSGFRLTGGNSGNNHRGHRFTTGTPSTLIVGCAMNFSSNYNTSQPLLSLLENTGSHVELRFNGSNQIYVTRAGTTLGTAPNILLDDVWYYIEWKVTIHDTTGSVTLRIDETEVLSLTNQDTRNSGSGYANTIQISSATNIFSEQYGVFFDDLIVMDDSGSANNDFLGDVHIGVVFPNDNGTTSDLVGSDGNSTDNYLLVDETTPDGDSTWVQSNTVGQKDTYNYGDVSFTTGDIWGVQIVMNTRKTDAGPRQIATVARLSSTEEDGPNETLSTTYQYFEDIREEKPGGGVWTATDINNAEFGVKVTA